MVLGLWVKEVYLHQSALTLIHFAECRFNFIIAIYVHLTICWEK